MLQQQIADLRNAIESNNKDSTIIQTVFFEVDIKSPTTTVGTDSRGDTMTIPKTPDMYLRTQGNGRTGNVPFFYLT